MKKSKMQTSTKVVYCRSKLQKIY